MKKTGFTLIELLVAMGLASIVFLLTSSLLMTVITANSKSQKTEIFEKVKNDLGMELSGVVRWGKDIKVLGNGIMVDGIKYHNVSGRIYKNGEPITPENIEVSEFEVKDFSTDKNYASVVISAELANKTDSVSHDELRIVVSQRKQEVTHE